MNGHLDLTRIDYFMVHLAAGNTEGVGGLNLYSLTRDDHRPRQKNARTN